MSDSAQTARDATTPDGVVDAPSTSDDAAEFAPTHEALEGDQVDTGPVPPMDRARVAALALAATAAERGPVVDVPTDPWIGRTLSGLYVVEKKLGEGGMGAVYVARHVHLGKQYAVKVLTAAVAMRREAVDRLRQEAIASSSIEHDNIVDVISFDRYEDGSVFIVMELLRGESLADRLARGGLEVRDAVSIALDVASALDAAHELGIVHRDLKPDNVFLAQRGETRRVKVLDFGISKVKVAESEQVRVTRTGQLVGTPLYMSPEQARGEVDVDRRVDVYALGVMLFEMLTGAPPFDGRNYFELLWKHGNETAPSMRARRPELDAALDDVVLKALAKPRDERHATMAEMTAALIAAMGDDPRTSLHGAGGRASDPRSSTPRAAVGPSTRPPGGASDATRRGGAANQDTANQDTANQDTGSRAGDRDAGAQGARVAIPVLAIALLVIGGGAWALLRSNETAARETISDPTTQPTEPRPGREREVAGSRGSEPGTPPPNVGGAAATPTTGPTPTSEPTPTTEPTPGTERALPPPGIEPPTRVIALASEPSGAVVWLDDRELCTTPCDATVPVERVSLTLRRAGFADTPAIIEPGEGPAAPFRLRARRRDTTPATGFPPIKRTL